MGDIESNPQRRGGFMLPDERRRGMTGVSHGGYNGIPVEASKEES